MGVIVTEMGARINDNLLDIILYPILNRESALQFFDNIADQNPQKKYYTFSEIMAGIKPNNELYFAAERLSNYRCKFVR